MADIRAVYRQFSPAPLGAGQENLYVDLDDVRGNAGLVRRMAEKIRLSDEPVYQVITGYRGSGKSTELWRLTRELTEPQDQDHQKYEVVTLRAVEVLDPAEAAGAKLADVFEVGVLRELILFTGGQPTELMTMTREAIVAEGLPVGTAGLARCRKEAERGYARNVLEEHKPLLKRVAETGQVPRSTDTEPVLRDLLASRTVLLYRNDEEWYDLNPAVRHLV